MAGNGSYSGGGDSRGPPSTGEPEFAADPATGSFFSPDFKRHEDLKQMLDSNKDGLKLEAMKRIIGMVAKGKDASDLFPAVVKNVVSKNIEVKKLVYVYLVRYAEEQQDLALLSISTFQRALKDPNPFIRASAVRVLSSIRVPVIIPIMMLAIKDAVSDMSPYVRRTSAHAIPKLYSLDPEQKDQLIEVIEKLLSDKTTLVVGSAVMAFEEVCPERIDLIHKNYRKLCNLLVDVEEWGQIVIINMLTRYARTQFTDPNKFDTGELEMAFYEDENELKKDDLKETYVMDQDHRLLLRNTKPLLQSRNAAVVMAIAQLYHYLAPKSEVNLVAKSLIRLLRGHRESQSVVLCNIATMSTQRRGMFEPYLKSFFIRSSDPTHIKLLKLEILTNLATDSNISVVLREFQTYVASADKAFVASTIQAIGRCASNIKEVTDTCLNGLVSLMSNRSEAVVAESVVVIKKLLQMQPARHKDIIVHMSRLIDSITVPSARASILWLLGEYSEHATKIAPDVLRKMAKTFTHEEDLVKLQVLNLATKLYLTNPKQTHLLCQYVFNLAKYDQSYDIRDRSRFLRQILFPFGDKDNVLSKHAKKIFLSSKPAPLLESKFKDSDQYQMGSLSHYLNQRCAGYQELPDFPENPPDPSVRAIEVINAWDESSPVGRSKKTPSKKKPASFYSESESSSATEARGSSSSESSDDSSSSSESSDDDSDTEDSEKQTRKNEARNKKARAKKEVVKVVKKSDSSESDEEEEESTSSESEDSDSESEESDSDSDGKNTNVKPVKVVAEKKTEEVVKKPSAPVKQEIDLLLDLDDIAAPANGLSIPTSFPVPLNPTTAGFLTPIPPQGPSLSPREKTPIISTFSANVVTPAFIPTAQEELLNKITGNGLSATYRFTRGQNVYSDKMTTIELTFNNGREDKITGIRIGQKNLAAGMDMHAFPEIESLPAGGMTAMTVGVDFNESTQPATFEICAGENSYSVSIRAPVGELLQPVSVSDVEFTNQQAKLKGLNENSVTVELASSLTTAKAMQHRIYEAANLAAVIETLPTDTLLRFSGRTLSSKLLILLTCRGIQDNKKAALTVNCEKVIVGSVLLKEIKTALAKH